MKVIGFQEKSFKGDDGNIVEGMNIFCSYESDRISGVGAERIYCSMNKLNKSGYYPSLGDDIEVQYNRYGKIAGIRLN